MGGAWEQPFCLSNSDCLVRFFHPRETALDPETPQRKMSAAALNDMKCWAAAMLVFSILSFNLAIFITGIVGCSLVLCCASSNEQVCRPAPTHARAQPRAASTAPALGRIPTVTDRRAPPPPARAGRPQRLVLQGVRDRMRRPRWAAVSQSVSHCHTPTNGAHGPHKHARS